MPELPLIADTVPGVDVSTWGAFFAPSGTPERVLRRLHEAINEQLADPEVRSLLSAQGLRVEAMTRGELQEFVKREARRHAELARATKLKRID